MDNLTIEIGKALNNIKEKKPLIHNITNYVTVNDCANVILAIGASPIMADDIDEVEAIVSISSALVINIGTLNKRTVLSMSTAGKMANEKGIPVIFDPVGAGASQLRNRTTDFLLEQVKMSVIRGNLSEIGFITGFDTKSKGVDASDDDIKNSNACEIAKKASEKFETVVAITGEKDFISDGNKTIYIENGNSAMSNITGTGCMCSALIGSFCGANQNMIICAAGGIASMGIAGEISYENNFSKGFGSFHIGIIDEISKLNSNILNERVKIHEI